MAFDGSVIACLCKDLNDTIIDGRVNKIAQPENDELIFTIKTFDRKQVRLLLSANASLPLVYFLEENKPSPLTAPNFCMLLRKHIGTARIVSVEQPEMERILCITFEHYDDMGDLCTKKLYIEVMGKHSNIIFCDDKDMILDAIKHIPASVSSIREVLPGRQYFIPKTQDKVDPTKIYQSRDEGEFYKLVYSKPMTIAKALYSTFNGFSPDLANELCYRASIDGDYPANALTEGEQTHLFHHFYLLMEDLVQGQFTPVIISQGDEPLTFGAFHFQMYADKEETSYDSISRVLRTYYQAKELYSRMRQKSVDLRKIVSTHLDRARRKYDLQVKQMKDTEKRDKYKIYGELLNTYGYQAEEGAKSIEVLNYYTNENLIIPLDETLNATQNAQKYFEKYNKLKRTYEALTNLLAETKEEMELLDSISTALDLATSEADLAQIKEELTEYGYIKRHVQGKGGVGNKGKKQPKLQQKSKPLHYISSDGFDIYVGKNNYQNDELTFKFATGNDWWFHAKQMPGSHVVVKTNGAEMTDLAYEEAASLAAYYSKGQNSEKVEIDYLQKKNVKKPNGAKAGFVIYYTNYSMVASPKIGNLQLVND